MRNFAILLLILSAPVPALSYNGHADYRLLFVYPPMGRFDPNQDVLVPGSRAESDERFRRSFLRATYSSMIPLMPLLSGSQTNINALEQVHSSVMVLRSELTKAIKNDPKLRAQTFQFFLRPWVKKQTDLFYGAEKLGMSGMEHNILGESFGGEAFDKELTRAIYALQEKLHIFGVGPVYILAMQGQLKLDPTAKSQMTIQLLMGLQPLDLDISDKMAPNPKVKFERFIIPELTATSERSKRSSVATMSIQIDLGPEDPETPTIDFAFGDFDRYASSEGSTVFHLVEKDRKKSAPYLDGKAQKWHLIRTAFAFEKFSLALNENLEVSDLSLFTRPGLDFGKVSFLAGGFRIESVNKEFEKEINTINKEMMDKTRKEASEKYDLYVKKADFKKVVQWIFSSRGES